MAVIEDILMIKGPDVIIAPSSSTVLEAARLMSEANVGSVIVKDGEEVKGIFTERDLLKRVMAADRDHERLFGSKWPLRAMYLDAYERHQLAVDVFCERTTRPLLVYKVCQGWRPLCQFLNKPIPPKPFPWRNRLATPKETESCITSP